jgi:DNA-binding MarR family transcriptional regulator
LAARATITRRNCRGGRCACIHRLRKESRRTAPIRAKQAVVTDKLGPVLEFMRSIWALDHALQKASKRMESSLGVTGPQRLALRIVGRFPGISAGELAGILHVDPSTLTGILKRLEGRKLVVRKADPADRRRTRLGLTAAGRRLDSATVKGTVEAGIREALHGTTGAQLATVDRVLSRVAAVLDEAG